MTTYSLTPSKASALLDAVADGARLYSLHESEIAWLECGGSVRRAIEWNLLEQLINAGALLPMPENERTRWTLPDRVGLSRFSI